MERVRYIGAQQLGILARGGIKSVADLLQHFPHRYMDRTMVLPISQLSIDKESTLIAEVVKVFRPRTRGRGPRDILKVTVRDPQTSRPDPDPTGSAGSAGPSMEVTFFNQPYRFRQLPPGTVAAFSGKVSLFRGRRQMTNPDVEVLAPGEEDFRGKVVPVHSAVGELTPNRIRVAMRNALKRARPIRDPLPSWVLKKHGLVTRDQAYAEIHFPTAPDRADRARRRLVFDELFRIQLALALTRHRLVDEQQGVAQSVDCPLVESFVEGLPYDLTGAQQRVLAEIGGDMASSRPMHRMLQGEVGSGKTVVALATLLAAVGSGNQAAIMAPTEVLAEQLYMVLREMLSHSGLSPPVARPQGRGNQMASLFGADATAPVRVALLTSSRTEANYLDRPRRSAVLDAVASGEAQIVVGTHSLIQEGVRFHQLGVAVVDEQHRFGVTQRNTLKYKTVGYQPDLLIMTATPIPRTLSMTLYGDLALSYIDEMPPGRSPVGTRLVPNTPDGLDRAYQVVRREVKKGRQTFVICPTIDDSERLGVRSVASQYQEICSIFPNLVVDRMHGQLSGAEKEAAMARFRAGETHILVSTTVIEVGIDIPNATVMLIADAQRFGLSQLHQLRGRVGRGKHPGRCLLVADTSTPTAEKRMKAMVRTSNGLELAEEDLKIRGQGTVFGARQSGIGDLRLADILRDRRVLGQARQTAVDLIGADPGLERHPDLEEELVTILGEDVKWLFDS